MAKKKTKENQKLGLGHGGRDRIRISNSERGGETTGQWVARKVGEQKGNLGKRRVKREKGKKN